MNMTKTKLISAILCAVLAMPASHAASDFGDDSSHSDHDHTHHHDSDPSPEDQGDDDYGNPATGSGQDAIKEEQKKLGDKKTESETGKSTVGDNNNTKADPIENESVSEAVAKCPLVKTTGEAMQRSMDIAEMKPNIDKIYNEQASASEGCFAASKNIINLSSFIPTINGGDLIAGIKQKIAEKIEEEAQKHLDKACSIANRTMIVALEPISDYIDTFESYSDAFTGLIGNVKYDPTKGDPTFGGVLDGLKESVNIKIGGNKKRIGDLSDIMDNYNEQLDEYWEKQWETIDKEIGNTDINGDSFGTPEPKEDEDTANQNPPSPVMPQPRTQSTPYGAGIQSADRTNKPVPAAKVNRDFANIPASPVVPRNSNNSSNTRGNDYNPF